MEIIGRYNTAKIYTESIDNETLSQIYQLVNLPAFANTNIRIMPDVHYGSGAVVGFTMTMNEFICPKVVGNPDWNLSVPHGAGRLLRRGEAKEVITLAEYKKSMEGIFTTSIHESTIDESPMVYKPMEEIISKIQDTVEVISMLKPVYNYKAGN